LWLALVVNVEGQDMKIKALTIFALVAAITIGLLAGCSSKVGTLTVSVTDSSGNPLWGAKVVSEQQPEGQLKVDGITEQEKGRVIFNGIKAGAYQFQVSRYGFAPDTFEVNVRGGQTTSVTVKLFYAPIYSPMVP
jgi:hypothetical protein